MSQHRGRILPVLISALLLVGAANLGAYAATGKPLLLGKFNVAGKATTLKNTGNGPALKLKAKKTSTPLKVNSKVKVKKLNADLVDGLDGDALKNKSFVYTVASPLITEEYTTFQLPGLPAGRYHASFSITAAVAGGPGFFACFVVSGTGMALNAPVVGAGVNMSGSYYFSSGSGYVDTTSATHRLMCERDGGTDTQITPLANFPSRIVFTRVDDVTEVNSTGTGSVAPRGITP